MKRTLSWSFLAWLTTVPVRAEHEAGHTPLVNTTWQGFALKGGDPLFRSIVGGRLILKNGNGAVELWEEDVARSKAKAHRPWPRIGQAKAGKKNPIDGLFGKSVLSDLN